MIRLLFSPLFGQEFGIAPTRRDSRTENPAKWILSSRGVVGGFILVFNFRLPSGSAPPDPRVNPHETCDLGEPRGSEHGELRLTESWNLDKPGFCHY